MASHLTRAGRALAPVLLAACAGTGTSATQTPSPASSDSSRFLVPAGYGSLHQEDIAINLQVLGLQVRAIPLDETVIRVLSPDSYRALRDIVASRKAELDAVARRTGLNAFSLWYVQYFGLEQGDTRFSPMEFIVTSVGQDFRPLRDSPIVGRLRGAATAATGAEERTVRVRPRNRREPAADRAVRNRAQQRLVQRAGTHRARARPRPVASGNQEEPPAAMSRGCPPHRRVWCSAG